GYPAGGSNAHRFGVLSGYDRCDYVDGLCPQCDRLFQKRNRPTMEWIGSQFPIRRRSCLYGERRKDNSAGATAVLISVIKEATALNLGGKAATSATDRSSDRLISRKKPRRLGRGSRRRRWRKDRQGTTVVRTRNTDFAVQLYKQISHKQAHSLTSPWSVL